MAGTSNSAQKKVDGEIAETCDNSVMECLKKHWLWAVVLVVVVVALVYYFCVHRKKAAAKKAEGETSGSSSSAETGSGEPVKVTKNRS